MLVGWRLFLKIFYVVDNDVVKNTLYKALNQQLYNLEKKIPDVSTLIQINQYNTDI